MTCLWTHVSHQGLLFPFRQRMIRNHSFPSWGWGTFQDALCVPPYWWYTPMVFVYWTEFWPTMTMPSLMMQASASKHIWTIKERLTVLGCQLEPTYYTHCHLLGDFCWSGDGILPNILPLSVNTWLLPVHLNICLTAGQPLAVHPSFIFDKTLTLCLWVQKTILVGL